jgi:hypothetical protein
VDGGVAMLPSAPLLTATTTLTEVELSWTTPDIFPETYTVLRSIDDGSTFTPLADATDISGLSAVDTNVVPGIAYQYAVQATDSAGAGSESNVVTILAAAPDLAAAGSDSRILLTWTPIENASSYDIYRVPSSGAPVFLSNTTNSGYYSDSAITAGETYTYELVSKSASQPSSIASAPATATALGVEITGSVSFVSDVGVDSYSAAMVFAQYGLEAQVASPDGGVTVFDSVSASDGSLIIPGVPLGPYMVTVSGQYEYVITSARALDYSVAVMGRPDAVDSADDGTSNNYDLTNLAPWYPGCNDPNAPADAGAADQLEEMCQGAGNFYGSLDEYDDGVLEPDAGATVFSGQEVISDANHDGFLVNSSEGDVVYLWQLHNQETGNGSYVQTAVRSFADTTLTQVDKAENPVDGGMTSPPVNTIPDVVFHRSQWTAQLPDVNPAAIDRYEAASIEVEPKYDTYGWYGASGDALVMLAPEGTSDFDIGSVAWQNPIPASANWDAFLLFYSESFLNITAGNTTTQWPVLSLVEEPVDANFQWATALSPTLSQPQNPQVGGASLFAEQLHTADANGVVTLSWSAPALGTPNIYRVALYEISDTEGDIKQVSGYMTASTSLALTSDQFPDVAWYFVTIDADILSRGGAPFDQTLHPADFPSTLISSELISNKFALAGDPFAAARAPGPSRLAQRKALFEERLRALPPALRKLAQRRAQPFPRRRSE